MPLSPHAAAPDFTLPSTAGQDFTLARDWAKRPGLLYFYPKDFTSVCTAQACGFREAFDVFEGLNVDIVGISGDTLETHLRFRRSQQLPFHLLADVGGVVARRYKAWIPLINVARRVTYLLDAEHRVAGTYENMFDARRHIDVMLEKIRQTS